MIKKIKYKMDFRYKYKKKMFIIKGFFLRILKLK
jgi:hypothetical protein